MLLMSPLSGLNGSEDRGAAQSYCGSKFGFTSPDYAPCVNFYVSGMSGDYKAAASGSSGSPPGGGGSSFNWNSLIGSITQGAVKGFFDDGTPAVATPTPGYVLPVAAAPWYTTPIGIGGLAAGALVLFLLLRK